MTLKKFLLFTFLFSFRMQAEDWPMYLKDLAHSSYNAAETTLGIKSIANLRPSWTYSAGASLGSAVTLSSGILYFGDWGGNFNAVDAQRGTLLWKSFLGKAASPAASPCFPSIGVSSQAVVIGNTVYAGGGDSAVYGLDKSNGNIVWRTPLADPAVGSYLWSSIVPYQNMLYVGVSSLGDCPIVRGAIARIDPQNPQTPLVRYVVPPDATGGGIWSTPVIDADTNTVFVTTANGDRQDAPAGFWIGAILKLDPETLTNQASYLLPESDSVTDLIGGSSPTLFTTTAGTPLLAVAQKNGILYAVRRSDLSLAWQTGLAISCIAPARGCGSISTPAFDGKYLYLGAGVRDPESFNSGSIYAINPDDGSVVWRKDLGATILSPTTVANGLLYVSTSRGLEIYDTATGQAVWNDKKRATVFSQPVVVNGTIYSTYQTGELVAWNLPSPGPADLFNFSAASAIPSLAAGAIASSFAADLSKARVTVEDSAGVKRPAAVLYSSSGQVNYVVPSDTAPGLAMVTATSASGTNFAGAMQVNAVAPGLFSANADGKGVAAAQALRVKSDGSSSFPPVFQCTPACSSQPIDLGAATDKVFLILYGTGIRNIATSADFRCQIGNVDATVTYIGPQPGFDGLDQVNVEIPQILRGRGEVDVILSLTGQLSNAVKVNIR